MTIIYEFIVGSFSVTTLRIFLCMGVYGGTDMGGQLCEPKKKRPRRSGMKGRTIRDETTNELLATLEAQTKEGVGFRMWLLGPLLLLFDLGG